MPGLVNEYIKFSFPVGLSSSLQFCFITSSTWKGFHNYDARRDLNIEKIDIGLFFF